MNTYVARQPIFNRQKSVYAYELLFRDGLSNAFPDIDGDVATTKLLSSSFFTMGLEKVSGGKRAFINFTESLLERELPFLFPKESTVVEILEDVKARPEIVAVCKKIAKRGYTIALDDFIFLPELEELIELADIIKIDFRAMPMEDIEKLAAMLSGRNKKLLAEKVETVKEFDQACQMGFDYFQGYFFCKPEIIQGKEISSTKMSHLRLISEVNKQDFSFSALEKIISQDVSFSFKLLRFINSAFFKRSREINSIREALLYLGQNEVRRFVSLIAMAKIASKKPNELLRMACIKARFCELMATMEGCGETPDTLFTLGIFSNIDAILDQPMDVIMKSLPLSSRIKDALGGEDTLLGEHLRLAECYEMGDWEGVSRHSESLNFSIDKIPPLYIQACEWANELAT